VNERGSASVLVIAVGALLGVIALAVGVVATGMAAHRQAVRAADLAALAGAQTSLTSQSAACRVASDVAEANGAELEQCVLSGASLQVRVRVATVELLPAIGASARAGFASADRDVAEIE
jgi:secretion/DNA translocation related TadE-like protein